MVESVFPGSRRYCSNGDTHQLDVYGGHKTKADGGMTGKRVDRASAPERCMDHFERARLSFTVPSRITVWLHVVCSEMDFASEAGWQ